MPAATAAIVIAADFLLVAACFPALRLGNLARGLVLIICGACVAASPLLLPAPAPASATAGGLRLIVAIASIWLIVQLYDLHVGARRGSVPDLRTLLRYLPNPAWIVCRKPPTPSTTAAQDGRALAVWSIGFAALLIPATLAFRWNWHGLPFVAEHAAKALLFCMLATAAGMALPAGLRLLGQPAMDGMDWPLLAHSPADFWRRRWNRPAQQFFEEDVYKPAGGRRGVFVRAALLTFAVSAVSHEYLFDIAAGRVLGYQVLFFMIQGIAVVLTRRARRTPLNVALTFAFNLVTSTLFFASFDAAVSFYANELPASLRALDASRLLAG